MSDKMEATLKVPLDQRRNGRFELLAPAGQLNGAKLTLFLRGRSGTRRANLLPTPATIKGPGTFALVPADFLGSESGPAFVQASLVASQPTNAGVLISLRGRLVLPDASINEELSGQLQLAPKAHAGILDLTWWIDE